MPFRPDFVGKNIPTSHAEMIRVKVKEYDGEDSVTILQKVIEKLRHPAMRKAATERIKEQAKPSVRTILRENQETIQQNKHRSHQEER